MIVTKEQIDYQSEPYGHIATIPAGTECIPADNLPEKGQFWVEPWQGMSETEESWSRNYGFLVSRDQVTEKLS